MISKNGKGSIHALDTRVKWPCRNAIFVLLCLISKVQAKSKKERRDENGSERRVQKMQKRFESFATIQVDGECFMTPADFLEAVTEAAPRKRNTLNILVAIICGRYLLINKVLKTSFYQFTKS